MNSAESFSASYAEARAKFRAAAGAAGGRLESVAHPEPGPDGGDLTTDIAWFGPKADKVLLMISATHGVEGFCGSGAQVDWLRRGEAAALPADVAVLMIHAINPYGFAWLRRVTHENVDLNRNWVDFSASLPENAGYDGLNHAICPTDWSEAGRADAAKVIGAYAAEHGFAALQQAVSGGQYRHPSGIFYGGSGPTWSRMTQSQIMQAYLGHASHVGIIDFHTGLGPWGFGEKILSERSHTPQFKRAAAWYGRGVTCPAEGNSTSADIVGDGLAAAPGLLPKAEITAIALEFGTQTVMQVLDAVRADAWLHAHGELTSPQGKAIKAQIREAFYGDADDWKGMIAGQALLAGRQAVAALAAA